MRNLYEITIRKARKEDFEQIFELETKYAQHNNKLELPFFRYNLNKNLRKKYFLKRIRQKYNLYLVLEDAGILVGFFHGQIQKMNGNGFEYK